MKSNFENEENCDNYYFNSINNNIISSFPDSFSEYIFKNINEKEINNYKCISCDQIPLFPKVLKPINNEKKENRNKIVCNKCYLRINQNESLFKEYLLDRQSSNIVKQIIGNYKVSCLNLECDWEGKLSQLNIHMKKECKYQPVKCPNKECKLILLRKELNYHLIHCYYDESIKIKCNFCKKEIRKRNIEEHFEECPEILIDCDKNCGKKIKRKDLVQHKLVCFENIMKCKFWIFGCKKLIKRKYKEDHEKLEIYNHYNLINEFYKNKIEDINEKIKVLNIINKLEIQIKEKEKKEEEVLLKKKRNEEEREKNNSYLYWNTKIIEQNKLLKNYKKYDEYIPFTGNPITFVSERENINNKIIILKNEKIYYSGNYYNNLKYENYYFVISKDNLDFNSNTIFSFKIYPDPSTNSLPWLAFGLYNINKRNNNDINIINSPNNGLYCIDLESNTCNNSKMNYSESDDKLNIDNIITLSYLPKDKCLIIKDRSDFEINFFELPNNNCDLRLCFIFKGKDRAIIDYKY